MNTKKITLCLNLLRDLSDAGDGFNPLAKFLSDAEPFFVCDGGPVSNDYAFGAEDCSPHSLISNHTPKTYINIGGKSRTMRGVAKNEWSSDAEWITDNVMAADVFTISAEDFREAVRKLEMEKADAEA